MAEWLKAPVCKTGLSEFVGSNPTPSTMKEDITLYVLIPKKVTPFGLACPAWQNTLSAIKGLPEIVRV